MKRKFKEESEDILEDDLEEYDLEIEEQDDLDSIPCNNQTLKLHYK